MPVPRFGLAATGAVTVSVVPGVGLAADAAFFTPAKNLCLRSV